MKNAPCSIALVGCGAVSRLYYAPALQELERQELVRVAVLLDPDETNASTLQRIFPAALVVPTLKDVCSHRPGLAIVASPHSLHAAQSIELLESHIPVLCEKPIATSVADATAMAATAGRCGTPLAIGMVRRFLPATRAIRRILQTEMLGKLVSFRFAEGDATFSWPVASSRYFSKTQARGGVLMDIGVHALDLMRWWLGEPGELVYEDDAMGGIEVNCRIRCRFDGGCAGEVRLSRDCALANRYEFVGRHGTLLWNIHDANHLSLDLHGLEYRLNVALEDGDRPARNFEQSFVAQIRNVVLAARSEAEIRVPAGEAIESLKLVEHCYRVRTPLQLPWLSDRERDKGAALGAASAAANGSQGSES